jgi:hypothetical protein
VRRDDRFLISRAPYAVDLSSLHGYKAAERTDGTAFYRYTVTAVWFRRRKGVTVACIGELWDYQTPEPESAEEFLARHDDGRYGGDCKGRWDGIGYWGAEEPAEAGRHLGVLRPMLENYPAVPPGFDGWWTFKEVTA